MIITNLLTNMIILSVSGRMPTNIVNTPALNDYAFQYLYARAQRISMELPLDEGIVDKDNVTSFKVTPQPEGPVVLMVFHHRYCFTMGVNDSLGFSDAMYEKDAIFPATSSTDMEAASKQIRMAYEKFRLTTNHLSMRKARRIAASSLKIFGVDVPKLPGFRRVKSSEQMKFEDTTISHFEPDGSVVVQQKKNGAVYPLPYYTFEWESMFPSFTSCTVEVSGVSSNVVTFYYVGPWSKLSKHDHYLEMLGLPPDTVFVRPRMLSPGTYEVVGPSTD